MTTEFEACTGDVPLGFVGRLFGLRVVPPEIKGAEEVRWSARANMMQWRVRAVGGRLYLTDRRLIFARNRTESLTGGKEWSADLADLRGASVSGKRSITVEDEGGRVERFIIGSVDESATMIDRAIRSAS